MVVVRSFSEGTRSRSDIADAAVKKNMKSFSSTDQAL